MSGYLSDNRDSNQIGDEGCAHLSKANWKNMINLWLGNHWINQVLMASAMMAVLMWQKQTGKSCISLTCVLINDDLDSNRIGDKGCAHLIKADWKKLYDLNLCKDLWM